MGNLMHRFFGFGRIPKKRQPELQSERIVLMDEGISGVITFRNFRAPGRWYYRRKSWITGSVVLTKKRLAAFQYHRPIIDVPLDHEKFSELEISLKGDDKLCLRFDAGTFNEKWSGEIEVRYSTPKARLFVERIRYGV